ncbi:hypothetical protein GCM10022393_14920 [Aquimarina addita]|uniref:Secretion system C-terminal sorting domain-containing protein n=2 Tax=Aquimarina addita TaxID=870485 RepID=A0ABP7XFU5_9FLAO
MVISLLFNNQHIFAQCNTIIDVDFNNWNDRRYSIADIKSDFNNKVKPWTGSTYRGVEGPGAANNLIENTPQETRIVNGTLRAQYLKNDASGRSGGFLFDPYFDGVEEAYLEYKIKFDDNFFWATGGKLPGLGGSTSGINSESTGRGTIPSGCRYNTNGWSARLMWRRNRAQTNAPYFILYSYFADKENGDPRVDGDCGDGKRIYTDLKDDKWYTIRQYIKMNTPGQRNGTVIMWIDGEETYRDDNAKIRNSGKSNLKINALIMNTYRGGSRTDEVWHSPRTEYTFFDDFKVWTGCSNTDNNPNQLPTVALTNPSQNNQTFTLGETITLRANAADPDGDVDRVNFKINGSYYKLDKTSPYSVTWTPTEAGTYTIGARAFEEGQEGLSTEVIRTIIVTTDTNNNTSCSYGTPVASGIGAMDKISYSNTYVVGNGGPNLSNIKEFSINWNPQYNGLYQFAFNTKNGTPDWYIDYKNSMSYQLKNAKPEVTLSNTGIANLDGSYWVTKNGNDFVMVSKTKAFSIYFSNSSSTPACNKASVNQKIEEKMIVYPNPIKGEVIHVGGLSTTTKSLQIVDLRGRIIKEISSENTSETIDVSDIPAGSYLLINKSKHSRQSILFIK